MNFLACRDRLPPARRWAYWMAQAAVGVLAFGAGCAGPPASESEWDRRTTVLLQARKATSQAAVDRDSIAGEPADRYVNRRTALLLGGSGKVTTNISPNGRTAVVGWELQPGQGAGAVSSAAAVSADGYFLTAAHAVNDKRMQLVRSGEQALDVARVRVVWRGDPAIGGPDLALIHAPVTEQQYFPIIDPAAAATRARVWTGGFGDVRQNQSRGWLRAFGPWRNGDDGSIWRTVEHTAPLMRGDSGGPLVGGDGQLLGVNTEFLVQPASLFGRDHLRIYRPMAVGADPEWIDTLILRDRATLTRKRSRQRP